MSRKMGNGSTLSVSGARSLWVARRAFTLVETVVAMLLTSLLVLAVFGGLTFVSRGYRRDELAMARAQVAQSVSELLADDLRHLSGNVFPTSAALKHNGYEGFAGTFVAEPRRGTNLLATYSSTRVRRDSVVRLAYNEEATLDRAGWSYQVLTSHYLEPLAARQTVPMPWGIVRSAILVPLPPGDDPDVVHLALSTRHDAPVDQVLWSFWRRRRGKFEAGTILRHGPDGGRVFTGETPLIARLSLTSEWVRVVSPRNTSLEPLELILDLELKETGDLALPFAEPQFRVRRTFTAGL